MLLMVDSNTLKKYFRIWWILTTRTTQIAFASRFSAMIFIFGKLLRFVSFLVFLLLILSRTRVIAGYTAWQVIFFYATFNLIDTLPQIFMREVYRFRWQVVNGYFDHTLVKPFSALFKTLFGGSDALDLSILTLSLVLIGVAVHNVQQITMLGVFLYLALVVNAFLIAVAFHICVLAIGILTTEVDNTIMIYRDITQMGRVPIDVYIEPVRSILTFAVPVGIMMSYPPKALMGFLSAPSMLVAFSLGIFFLFASLWFWRFSLKLYESASS